MNAQLFAATMLGHSAFRDSKITITLEEHKEMLDDFRRNGWKNRVTRLSKSAINTITEFLITGLHREFSNDGRLTFFPVPRLG
jgi:hypothetical protein